MNLSQVVISKEEVNLVGEVALELRDAVERFPASFGAVGVVVVAVNHFMKDQMAVWIARELGDIQELVEIAAMVVQIEGSSYRLRQHTDLVPEHIRSKALIQPPPLMPPPRRRGRPPKHGAAHQTLG